MLYIKAIYLYCKLRIWDNEDSGVWVGCDYMIHP